MGAPAANDGRTRAKMTDAVRAIVDDAALGAFIDSVPHGLLIADVPGTIVHANRAAETLLGFAQGELRGLTIEDLVPVHQRALHVAHRAGLPAAGDARPMASGRSLAARRKDGSEVPVLVGFAPWRLPTGTLMVASLVDNTARRDAEAWAESQFRAAVEAGEMSQAIIRDAALGILIYDAESGQCVSANEMACRITGLTEPQMLEQRFRDIVSWRQSGMLACAEHALADRRTMQCEARITTSGGRNVVIGCEFLAITRRGQPHLVLMMDDLTERRNLEDQLRVAQKMEAVGQLAGGIAHDFNNLLTVIGTYSTLLLADTPEEDPRREDLAEILSAATRAATLTRQLLAFGRRQILDPRLLDLTAVVGSLEKMLRRVLSAEIALEIAGDPATGAIHGDAGQLEQVVMNLVVNARDAMPDGGTIRIDVRNVEVVPTESELPIPAERAGQPLQMVRLSVTDTGTGMPPEIVAHVFEPFFTTKAPGRGSGLGLSTTYGIVKQSGGFIRVRSQPGAGTTFEVYLPRITSGSAATVADAPVVKDSPGSGDILVVEDDEQVRRIVVTALRDRGYTVFEAGDGEAALALAAARDEAPDLVVTDVIMPRVNGRQLVSALRDRWPGLRVLFTSAYAMDDTTGRPVTDLPGLLLRKPFVPSELGAAVAEALRRDP
ncbi:MAG: PAS domain S-box protein [Gemmatimonadota bacterium]|nr:PAS domain S-box protein [Gemmatimonadota bacterium]